ncbi:thiamine biosynthesis protein ThiI [Pontibacillus halophilus JSM 076056 = DSM 19796]|uniref:Probable tRNA sulfurtransferase n=1 Tax=Pontibacillus halophilus JSM 076056 = DSM 19796 TaxID=1385510 RepID=A0A0A5GQ96_9BACI|nr:tRNA uracil 4-sulfurtransferase ThiI [Pontibacillus halophilus]KGX93345.1 thiamine biosynthesis protein ThiI [Pontibacillus halophilus JSM 076056 = DSM 19796]
MEFNHILVRYGELALKGKNKKQFVDRLHENVRRKLVHFPNTKIVRNHDRMYIELNGEDPDAVLDKCKEVFGIQSFSLAMKVDSEEQAIKDAAVKVIASEPSVKTFKVTTKRVKKNFPIGSQDFNRELGGYILRNVEGLNVDVHNPDMDLHIEIRGEGTYITSKKIKGAGGLPVGTTGKSLLLLSGGIDSPVAGHLAMKRGVEVEAIHFHSPPYTSDRAKEKVLNLAKQLTKYGAKVKVHIVPFTKLQQTMYREIPDGYGMTAMRRMMLRISERVAEKEGILSLTTGESLGQVASQTMESMSAINEVTNYPIIRPLIAMDKLEIIDISKEIGTYETSIEPFEDCCTVFVPNQPKTKPDREKIKQYEASVDYSAEIEETIAGITTVTFKEEDLYQSEFDDLL